MHASIPQSDNNDLTEDDFRDRVAALTATIAETAVQAGRLPEEVRLLPVSKSFSADVVATAVRAGLTVLGENRPLEMAEKAQVIPGVQWCIIGPVQRNKAREVAQYAHELHSLDSLRLAETLEQRLVAADRHLDVLLQVNASHEQAKHGLHPDEVAPLLDQLAHFERVHVRGLMTLAAYSTEETVVRSAFQELRELRDRLVPNLPDGMSLQELSMGMSSDYRWAILEGSTTVRIGTAIFGHRSNSVYLK